MFVRGSDGNSPDDQQMILTLKLVQLCIVYHSQTSSSKEELEKSFTLFSLTQSAMDTFPATLLVRKTFQTHTHIHTHSVL